MNKQRLIILTGPTAVGKTALSIALAKRLNAEIISADSMQIYRGMDIGTAKVTVEEMDGVPHHLIDEMNPDEAFNVVEFQKRAKAAAEDIASRGKMPLIVGGTGFYIQALLYDIDFREETGESDYRMRLERIAAVPGGSEVLYKLLSELDPASAEAIHPNNVKRVIRALEFLQMHGSSITEHNAEQRRNESNYDFVYFVLYEDRETMYEKIERRVDLMLDAGLVDEVRRLRDAGYGRGLISMQGIGYKEVEDFLDGRIDEETMVSDLKRNTRHFAKRQLTWFRREKAVHWLYKPDFADEESILQEMERVIAETFRSAEVERSEMSESDRK